MRINAVPAYDMSDNPTGCCPRFDPTGWEARELHFRDKRFVRAVTRSVIHMPLNMRGVFVRTLKAIEDAGAQSDDDFIVLSRDRSAWSAEHFFSVGSDVPGQEMTRMTGNFTTKVFEGPYRDMPKWFADLADVGEPVYFFYTTCPKCAKYYGKNYVVGVAQTP